MPEQEQLRFGVAGWSYPHWDAAVYPRPRRRGFDRLRYLSRFFDTIEINSTFYRAPRPEVARLWLERVKENPRFRFTAKLSRHFTHERRLEAPAIHAFRRGLRPLAEAGRLGCVLMQFPWSFKFSEENRDFFVRLRREFSEFPLVAEMRHSSWLREEALGLFIDYHVGFCNLDQPQRQSAMGPLACLTSPIGYIRLHGRGYGRWFQSFEEPPREVARRDYLYSGAELSEWKQRLDHIARFADSVYFVTTNEEGGRSIVNALQMQALYAGSRREAPRALAQAFRRELAGFQPDGPVQHSLFEAARAVA